MILDNPAIFMAAFLVSGVLVGLCTSLVGTLHGGDEVTDLGMLITTTSAVFLVGYGLLVFWVLALS